MARNLRSPAKFRVLVTFPIGVSTLGRPKPLVEAVASAQELRRACGPGAVVALVPDLAGDARYDEDVLEGQVAPPRAAAGPPPEEVPLAQVVRELSWEHRLLWALAGVIVWCWWRWEQSKRWLYGPEEVS